MLQAAALLSSPAAQSVLAAPWQSCGMNISPSSYIAAGLAMLQSSLAGAAWAVELNRYEEGAGNGASLNAAP